jgi:hypothetical protein
MPIRAADLANNAFGLNPFGVHIGDHGIDGHPGWDVEYVVGSTIYAAAAGTVQSVLSRDGEFVIQLTHTLNGREAYRTIYGVRTVASGVVTGASITQGQALGIVSSYTRTIGTITVTYAFTHFQLDDFSANSGLTNMQAVSPEAFLNPEARAIFEVMWRNAFYTQELVEPFFNSPRDVTFPMTRTWTQQTGTLTPRLEVTRANAATTSFTYTMRDASGASTETGTIELEMLARPLPTIDFVAANGSRRRGVFSIESATMQLVYGASGAARVTTLAGASTYSTPR